MIPRTSLFLSAAVFLTAAAASTAALAADVTTAPIFMEPGPPPERLPVAEPRTSWCYVGVQGRLQHLTYDQKLLSGPYFNNTVPPADDHKGYATMPQVGLQAGCDMLRGSIVVGVEIEGWISPGDPPREPGHAIDPVTNILDIKERPSGAISLRSGVLQGNMLFFGKIGLAMLQTEFDTDFRRVKARETGLTESDPWQIDVAYRSSGKLRQAGLLLGAGVEYMIGPNWSAKAEFNQIVTSGKQFNSIVDAGTRCDDNDGTSVSCSGTARQALGGEAARNTIKMGRSIFKIGVNRRF